MVSGVAGNEKDGRRAYMGQRVDLPLPDDFHENNDRRVLVDTVRIGQLALHWSGLNARAVIELAGSGRSSLPG